MKILTKILIAVAVIIAIPFVIALFVNNKYVIEREIVINRPKQEVFNYVRMLKNQDHYSKWVMMDPNMKKEFRGTDGEEGFVYGWNGNKQAGEGEQEIKKIIPGERVDVEVRFKRPMAGIAQAPIITEAIDENSTKVRWGMQGESKYPFNIMNLFTDKILGKDVELSLQMLKNNLEK